MIMHRRHGRLAVVSGLLLAALAVPAGAGELVRDDGRTRGSAAAPVTLIEYSDFTCGFCVKWFRDTWPRLKSKYIDAGLVRFVYRDFPRASQGLGVQAAVAARCAGEQGQYWGMHDRLFGSQRLTPPDVLKHATAMGLNATTFTACFMEGRYTDAIARDKQEGIELGFHGTPGFVLQRTKADLDGDAPVTIPGAFPFEVFDEQIERLLAAAKPKG